MTKKFFYGALLAVGLAGSLAATAEDIDLFVQPPGAVAGVPNVLILLDNTANWSRNVGGQSIFINEIAALVSTLNDLPVDPVTGAARFRVGLMMFTETGNPNNNIDGGYVRAAIRDMNAANKSLYMNLLNSLHVTNDRSNGGKAGLTFAEAYRYFDGGPPRSGNNKQKTDYTGNVSGTLASRAVYALPGNAINGFVGTPYNSPIADGDCGGNYIIYISNGAAQDNNADTTTATTLLAQAALAAGIPGSTTAIPISPSGSQNNVADEWSRFMYRSPRNIVTYTVDVDRVTTGQGPGWSALLRSIAGVSNGKYFDVGSTGGGAQIADALGRIFSEIQAVNSVFASVALPVSVNTQGTYLNQVYVGQFRPDADAYPRWAGNLKQYKLGLVDGALRTLDADDAGAINPATGFISECARSFWTPSTTDLYWQFRPAGGCLAVPNSDFSNYPDGNIVDKGAQAHRLRSATATGRNLRTCKGNCSAGLINFSTTTILPEDLGLGAAETTERNALVSWQRGQDLYDENLNGNTTEMRPSAHGDVVHSRPVAINYGTDAVPKVVVFYGGNDGVLRAVNGNRQAAIGTSPSRAAGDEMWSFVPPEFFGRIKRLRDNTMPIRFTGSIEPPVRGPKPYGMDGPIVGYTNAGDTWIFTAMRRGGRVLYAFDVSGIAEDTPVAPTLKWRRGCPNLSNDDGCSSDYEGLGQTWSEPKVLKTLGHSGPMLIMGGGYDPCEDSDPHSCSSPYAAKGRGVYVINADTGARLKLLATDRPVVGDVFVVPDGSTGLARLAYAADTGGNVYRISGATANAPLGGTAPADWTITKIASLGCDGASDVSPTIDCPMNRKFLYGPDVLFEDGIYYLLLGSGDREKPIRNFTAALGVQNYFFMIKDSPASATWLSDENATCGSDILCLDSLVVIDGADNPDAADLLASKGWALELRAGEQAVTSAITVFGATTFSTHEPTLPVPGACTSNLGTARVYNVRFRNAAAIAPSVNRDAEVSGGGLPPSPVAGQVTLDSGVTVPFIIGASPTSPLESSLPSAPATGSQPRAITYWFIEK